MTLSDGSVEETPDFSALSGYARREGEKTGLSAWHEWTDALPADMKEAMARIRDMPEWRRALGDGIVPITGMDEIFLSRPSIISGDLLKYGASGNYIRHVDGMPFPFQVMKRVLLCIDSDGVNDHTETKFFEGKRVAKSAFLSAGEYVIFDFDRDVHEVINHCQKGCDGKYRVLIKLHFIQSTPFPVKYAKMWYVAFEKVTRAFMNYGTKPETLPQFVTGLWSEIITRWRLYPVVMLALLVAGWVFPERRGWLLAAGATMFLVPALAGAAMHARYLVYGKR